MKKILYFYILLNLLSFAIFAQQKRNIEAKDKTSVKSVLTSRHSKPAKQKNRELKILFKPRPNFTDEARKRNTEGIVELKITFNENGKVGIIEVIKGLPSGLTENAIKAAKLIKFKPAIKNRKLVKATITIEYIFDFF